MRTNLVFAWVVLCALPSVACQPKTGAPEQAGSASTKAADKAGQRADRQPAATEVSNQGAQSQITAGSKGEPPGELKSFVPPIELVEANGYLDGGTTYVMLRDSRDVELVFCVYQDAFEDDPIPGNSLFLGATHPEQTSARRPFTQEEASLVISSLEAAVKPLWTPDRQQRLKQRGDPGEEVIHDRVARPPEQQFTPLDVTVMFARDALRRARLVKQFDLADRAEVAERAAKLSAVDLDSAARDFRERAGQVREDEWRRLEPVLNGEVSKLAANKDLKAYFTQLLGPADESRLEDVSGMVQSPFGDNTPIEGRVLAYDLGKADGMVYTLVVDFRDRSRISFGEIASTDSSDDPPTPHDLISQEEKELGERLNAISINLGGGSLDGRFKQGFALTLSGDEVTDETLGQLDKLSTLVALDLIGTQVTDQRLAILEGHPYLASVTLQDTEVTDDGLLILKSLPTLKFLTLDEGKFTAAGVEALSKAAPQCEVEWEQQ